MGRHNGDFRMPVILCVSGHYRLYAVGGTGCKILNAIFKIRESGFHGLQHHLLVYAQDVTYSEQDVKLNKCLLMTPSLPQQIIEVADTQ